MKIYLISFDEEYDRLSSALRDNGHTIVAGASGKFERSVIRQCDAVFVSVAAYIHSKPEFSFRNLGVDIYVEKIPEIDKWFLPGDNWRRVP